MSTEQPSFTNEMLRTAMNAIHQQPGTGLMPAELAGIDQICDQVESATHDGPWHRAAYAALPPMDCTGGM